MSDERERDETNEEWDLDEQWEVVAEVGSDEEATLIAGYLQANDVPAQVESLRFHQEPVNFGRMGEVHVRVPVARREEALRLLSDRETAGLGAEADAAEAATEGTDPDSVRTTQDAGDLAGEPRPGGDVRPEGGRGDVQREARSAEDTATSVGPDGEPRR